MPQRTENGQPSPQEQLRALYEDAESRTAKAFEEAVGTPSFGAMLARGAENVAAMSRIGSDVADLVLRNLRIAGRSDITRLAKQLHRTEDKLERVLQEVEQLRDELAQRAAPEPSAAAPARANGRGAAAGTTRQRASSASNATPRRRPRAS